MQAAWAVLLSKLKQTKACSPVLWQTQSPSTGNPMHEGFSVSGAPFSGSGLADPTTKGVGRPHVCWKRAHININALLFGCVIAQAFFSRGASEISLNYSVI